MADDVAALGIEVDSSQVAQAASALQQFESIARRTGETVQQVQARFSQGPKLFIDNTNAAKGAATAMQGFSQAHTGAANASRVTASEMAGLSRAFGVLLQQLEHTAGALGRLGSFLVAFGGPGVAVGATLGAMVIAFQKANEMAEQLGEKAQSLKAFATTTGLTIEQIQGLKIAANELGVEGSTLTTFLDRFAFNLEQAHKATGPLFEAVQEINPALAQQLIVTKNEADALVLLAKAYEQAGAKRATLLQEAGGRGGLRVAPLIQAIAETRGTIIDEKAIPLTKQETEQLALLKAQLDTIREENLTLFSRMFSADTLQGQISYQHGLTGILETLIRIKDEDRILKALGPLGPILGFVPSGRAGGAQQPGSAGFIGPTMPAAASFRERFEAAQGSLRPGAEAIANQQKAINAAMGAGVTISDQFKLKRLELDAALEKNVITQEQYNKALGAEQLASHAQITAATVAALGNAATITEQYAAKSDQLAVELRRVGASQEIVNRAVEQLKLDKQIELMRESVSALGDMATAAEVFGLKLVELQMKLKQGRISQDTFNRAVADANPIIKELGSVLENNITTGLTAIVDGSKSASQGFNDLTRSVISGIEQMIIKVAIVTPLVNALKLALSSSGFLNLGAAGLPTPGSPSFIGPVQAHTGGLIGQTALPQRFVHPILFENAQRFHSGLNWDEIPAILQRGERVIPRGGGSGMAPPIVVVEHSVINNHPTAQISTREEDNGKGGRRSVTVIDEMVSGAIGRPGSKSERATLASGSLVRR